MSAKCYQLCGKGRSVSLACFALLVMGSSLVIGSGTAVAFDAEKFPGRGKREAFGKACEFNLKGIALSDKGKAKEAVEQYKKAIEVYPYYAVSYSNLGNALSDLHRYAEAVENYKRAVKLAPDFAGAYSNMGDALLKQKSYLAAEIACQNALKIDPGYVLAMTNLSEVYLETGRAQDARTILNAASGLTTTAGVKKIIAANLAKANKMLNSGRR